MSVPLWFLHLKVFVNTIKENTFWRQVQSSIYFQQRKQHNKEDLIHQSLTLTQP